MNDIGRFPTDRWQAEKEMDAIAMPCRKRTNEL